MWVGNNDFFLYTYTETHTHTRYLPCCFIHYTWLYRNIYCNNYYYMYKRSFFSYILCVKKRFNMQKEGKFNICVSFIIYHLFFISYNVSLHKLFLKNLCATYLHRYRRNGTGFNELFIHIYLLWPSLKHEVTHFIW